MGNLGRSANWRAFEAAKIRLLRRMTPEESLREYIGLQAEFGEQLETTESLYRQERANFLKKMQKRLRSLHRLRARLRLVK